LGSGERFPAEKVLVISFDSSASAEARRKDKTNSTVRVFDFLIFLVFCMFFIDFKAIDLFYFFSENSLNFCGKRRDS